MDPYPRSTPFIQVKQQNELGPAFNGQLADHHQFLFAHKQIEARVAPLMWNSILDTRVLIAEDLGAAQAPQVLARVEC